jgi:hypothetical protein
LQERSLLRPRPPSPPSPSPRGRARTRLRAGGAPGTEPRSGPPRSSQPGTGNSPTAQRWRCPEPRGPQRFPASGPRGRTKPGGGGVSPNFLGRGTRGPAPWLLGPQHPAGGQGHFPSSKVIVFSLEDPVFGKNTDVAFSDRAKEEMSVGSLEIQPRSCEY